MNNSKETFVQCENFWELNVLLRPTTCMRLNLYYVQREQIPLDTLQHAVGIFANALAIELNGGHMRLTTGETHEDLNVSTNQSSASGDQELTYQELIVLNRQAAIFNRLNGIGMGYGETVDRSVELYDRLHQARAAGAVLMHVEHDGYQEQMRYPQ